MQEMIWTRTGNRLVETVYQNGDVIWSKEFRGQLASR